MMRSKREQEHAMWRALEGKRKEGKARSVPGDNATASHTIPSHTALTISQKSALSQKIVIALPLPAQGCQY